MKKYLLLALLFLQTPVWATWSLVQVKGSGAGVCNGVTTCSVTVTSTGAGHLLVAGLLDSGTGNTISSVTSAACTSGWTHAPNSAASGTGDGSSDLFYCLNSASGQTSITVTPANSMTGDAIIWESSSTLGNIALDSGTTPSQHVSDTTCTSCAGVVLTLSGNNNFVAALSACGGTCSGLSGTGFTNDLSNPSGDGVGHGITSGSLTAPATWTQTSGTLVGSAAAFQESSGGASTPGTDKRIKLETIDPGVF